MQNDGRILGINAALGRWLKSDLLYRLLLPVAVTRAICNRRPDVRESRVFGRRDPRLGEVIEADLVLENSVSNLAAIREFCRAQLAAHKVPTQMHVVNELSRTAVTGKIQRRASA